MVVSLFVKEKVYVTEFRSIHSSSCSPSASLNMPVDDKPDSSGNICEDVLNVAKTRN